MPDLDSLLSKGWMGRQVKGQDGEELMNTTKKWVNKFNIGDEPIASCL